MEITTDLKNLVQDFHSGDPLVYMRAEAAVAKAIERYIHGKLYPKIEANKAKAEVIREGNMWGDITAGLMTKKDFPNGETIQYVLHFLAPGMEKEHVAYVMPRQGYIPQREVQGDYVQLPAFKVADAIDCELDYIDNGLWDVMGPMADVLAAGFIKKINDDVWHTALAAAVDRNIVVFDADASQGQLTKRLFSLGQSTMKRNGGGNSTSMNKFRLTDVYGSVEAKADVFNWGVDIVDEQTRRTIYMSPDGTVFNILGINLHELFELGVGQEYQNFFANELSGSLPSGDEEILIGFDLTKTSTNVMPIRKRLEVKTDPGLHRYGKFGIYGTMAYGAAWLDNRNVELLSI